MGLGDLLQHRQRPFTGNDRGTGSICNGRQHRGPHATQRRVCTQE